MSHIKRTRIGNKKVPLWNKSPVEGKYGRFKAYRFYLYSRNISLWLIRKNKTPNKKFLSAI